MVLFFDFLFRLSDIYYYEIMKIGKVCIVIVYHLHIRILLMNKETLSRNSRQFNPSVT